MIRRTLLLCGVLSSVLYLATIDVIAALLYPDYHGYTAQMVSELMAFDAPTRTLMVPVQVLYNLLVFAFAAGVWAAAEGKRARRLTGAALVGYGVFSSAGLLLAPMDLRTAGLTEQTWVHIGVTALQGVFQFATLVFGAFVHRIRLRMYSFATLAAALGFGAWAGMQSAQEPAPWLGLTERISIYVWMIWLAVLAISLLPANGRPAARVP